MTDHFQPVTDTESLDQVLACELTIPHLYWQRVLDAGRTSPMARWAHAQLEEQDDHNAENAPYTREYVRGRWDVLAEIDASTSADNLVRQLAEAATNRLSSLTIQHARQAYVMRLYASTLTGDAYKARKLARLDADYVLA